MCRPLATPRRLPPEVITSQQPSLTVPLPRSTRHWKSGKLLADVNHPDRLLLVPLPAIVLFKKVCAVGLAAEDLALISGLVVGKSVGAEGF